MPPALAAIQSVTFLCEGRRRRVMPHRTASLAERASHAPDVSGSSNQVVELLLVLDVASHVG